MTSEKGMQELDSFLQTRSYIDGYSISDADKQCFQALKISPDSKKYPNVFRWYLHIASVQGTRFIPFPGVPPLQKEIDDIFAGDKGEKLPKETRAEMIASVKQEARGSKAKSS